MNLTHEIRRQQQNGVKELYFPDAGFFTGPIIMEPGQTLRICPGISERTENFETSGAGPIIVMKGYNTIYGTGPHCCLREHGDTRTDQTPPASPNNKGYVLIRPYWGSVYDTSIAGKPNYFEMFLKNFGIMSQQGAFPTGALGPAISFGNCHGWGAEDISFFGLHSMCISAGSDPDEGIPSGGSATASNRRYAKNGYFRRLRCIGGNDRDHATGLASSVGVQSALVNCVDVVVEDCDFLQIPNGAAGLDIEPPGDGFIMEQIRIRRNKFSSLRTITSSGTPTYGHYMTISGTTRAVVPQVVPFPVMQYDGGYQFFCQGIIIHADINGGGDLETGVYTGTLVIEDNDFYGGWAPPETGIPGYSMNYGIQGLGIYGWGYNIKGNRFHNINGNAILLDGKDHLITGNLFDNCGGGSAKIVNIIGRNTRVHGNWFDCYAAGSSGSRIGESDTYKDSAPDWTDYNDFANNWLRRRYGSNGADIQQIDVELLKDTLDQGLYPTVGQHSRKGDKTNGNAYAQSDPSGWRKSTFFF